MRPIREISIDQLVRIKFLLTDIDDTLTFGGLLPSASLCAMERLNLAGINVIPITGRPVGWCDHIARMWPVKGVVGENGAFYFSYDRKRHKMRQFFVKNEAERQSDRLRLNQIKNQVLKEIPGAEIASDQNYRIADLAIDFCEDVDPLSDREIKRIIEIFEEHGATARTSSIHVNGWFGSYSKLTTARTCLQDLFDIDIDTDNELIAYIGDSPNDEPMFSFFTNSVGVANVVDFELAAQPKWVTEKRSAQGFEEFAELLLYAIQPHILPRYIGVSIYRLDANIRHSTVVGIVGAGGIGQTLAASFSRYDYGFSLAILITIVSLVFLGEIFSNWIRSYLR